MNWLTLLQNVGAFAIASGLLAWLLKKLVSQFLSRDLETFKADLKRAHAVEIENLKSDLRAASFEHETRFARLHETRAKIVAELYKRLVQAEDAIRILRTEVQFAEQKEREKLFVDVGLQTSELVQFFEERRIYFDEAVCRLMDKQILNVSRAWLYGMPFTVSTGLREQAQKHLDQLANAIPLVRQAIEAEMREMLGVGKRNPLKPLTQ